MSNRERTEFLGSVVGEQISRDGSGNSPKITRCPLSVRHPGPSQFATRGLYMSADVRVLLFPLTKCDVFKHMYSFFPPSLIHFSKCLPRRLNKCLGRWGKVNLGQTASCWTGGESRVHLSQLWPPPFIIIFLPPSLLIVSLLRFLQSALSWSPWVQEHQTLRFPARSGPASHYLATGSQTTFDTAVSWNEECDANKACNRELRGPMCSALNMRHGPDRERRRGRDTESHTKQIKVN